MTAKKIKRGISDFLQQLIDEANESVETSKTKIWYVYQQALTEDYTPKEAKKLVEEKIVNCSKRYIREVLPEESKQIQDNSIDLLKNVEVEQVPRQSINTTSEPAQSPDLVVVTTNDGGTETETSDEASQTPEPEFIIEPIIEPIVKVQNELEKTLELLKEANEKIQEYEARHQRDEKRILQLVNDVMERDTIISKYKRMEDIRLEGQRKSLNQWKIPGDRPT